MISDYLEWWDEELEDIHAKEARLQKTFNDMVFSPISMDDEDEEE